MNTSVEALPKLGKFRASYLLTQQSLALVMKDKEILAFPILSLVVLLLGIGAACTAFFALAIFSSGTAQSTTPDFLDTYQRPIAYAVVFLIYFVSAFVATFFQAGLTAIVYGRLQGKDLSFMDGMRTAYEHIGKIFMWSLITATVGLVLRAISEKSNIVGKIVTSLLGAAWSVCTLFIVPTLILEKGTVSDAIKKSAETFKKTWGELAIIHLSATLFCAVLMCAVMAGIFALLFTGNTTIMIAAAVVLVLLLVSTIILASTLDSVFRVALYHYATTGTIPAGFDPRLITGAMKQKKA